MPSHRLEQAHHFGRRRYGFAENRGCEKIAKHGPCGVGCFRIVEWPFRCGHFPPPAYAVAAHFQQGNPAPRNRGKAGFEGPLEPHIYFAKNDFVDFHSVLCPVSFLTRLPETHSESKRRRIIQKSAPADASSRPPRDQGKNCPLYWLPCRIFVASRISTISRIALFLSFALL